jgi:hypothetical protein
MKEDDMMKLKVIDYHKGNTDTTLQISTLLQLEKFAKVNGYKAVWIDFDNKILWVTSYRKFSQR